MKSRKIFTLALAALTLCAALTGCGNSAQQPESSSSAAGQKLVVGNLEQNNLEEASRKEAEKAARPESLWEFKPYGSLSTMLMELNAGRVDALSLPYCVVQYLSAGDETLSTFQDAFSQQYHMATRKSDTALCEAVSGAIDALKQNGAMDRLTAQYITGASGAPAANSLVKNEGGETYIVAITGDLPPLDYVAADGTPAGFNVGLLNAIAEQIGCSFEIVQLDAAARLSALDSGKVDLVFWIGCWDSTSFEPDSEEISLTTSYFNEHMGFISPSTAVLDQLQATLPTPEELAAATKSTETAESDLVWGGLEKNSVETAVFENMLNEKGQVKSKGVVEFSSLNAMLLDLNADRVDGLLLSESVAHYLCANNDKLIMVLRKSTQSYRMATRTEDAALNSEINEALDALKSDGTIDQLVTDYITNANSNPAANTLAHHEGGETYTVAVTGDLPPLDYVAADGTPAGFNVALLNAIGEKTGCNFEIIQMDANARLSALESKKVDLIFWMRCWGDTDIVPQEDILITSPYFEEATYAVSYSQDVIDQMEVIAQATANAAPEK